MRKKAFIIPVAIFTLLAFGAVSPASALVDPATITVILGIGFLTAYAVKTTIDYQKTEDALAKAEEQLQARKGLQQKSAAAAPAEPTLESVSN